MSKDVPGQADIEITLDGEKVVLKPSYYAYTTICRELGGGLNMAIGGLMSNNIDVFETIIAAGLKLTPKGREGLGEKIFKTGTRHITAKLQEFVLILSNGGRELASEDVKTEGDNNENPPKD